jgi:hypothetical protein
LTPTGEGDSIREAIRPAGSSTHRKARKTLNHVAELLLDLEDLGESVPSGDARSLLDRICAIRTLYRPLRVYLGRLLRHLRETGALYRLGYLRLEEFAEEHLRLSERATRDLVRECELFEETPALEKAFATGRIGLRQACLIDRHALRHLVSEFIERAEQVTFRQFQREMRLVDKFSQMGMGRYMTVLPRRGLIKDLVTELTRQGWPVEDIARELATEGFAELADWIRSGGRGHWPGDEIDPAESSIVPLEVLVDLLLISTFDPEDARTEEVRQTFSTDPDDTGFSRRTRTIRFTAPEPIARHWYAALARIREEQGLIPRWACVILLVQRALGTWTAHDIDTEPSQKKILERDGYLCQAPGCSSRRMLEVHHIHFRSRGGDNAPSNRLTLCAAHHRHILHAGWIRLTGRAPDALRWEMGCFGRREPLLRLKGEKME